MLLPLLPTKAVDLSSYHYSNSTLKCIRMMEMNCASHTNHNIRSCINLVVYKGQSSNFYTDINKRLGLD